MLVEASKLPTGTRSQQAILALIVQQCEMSKAASLIRIADSLERIASRADT